MKVGDLVVQCDKVVKFGGKNPPKRSQRVGLVMAIVELPEHFRKGPQSDWAELVGRQVTVLWSNGTLHKRFSENSLKVISEGIINFISTRTQTHVNL